MIRSSLGKAVGTTVLAVALVASGLPGAFAQSRPSGTQQAQAPGQPAGEQARETSRGEVAIWLWPLAGLAVIGGVVAAASGGGGGSSTASVTSTAGTN
jgi:hypothetical protein